MEEPMYPTGEPIRVGDCVSGLRVVSGHRTEGRVSVVRDGAVAVKVFGDAYGYGFYRPEDLTLIEAARSDEGEPAPDLS